MTYIPIERNRYCLGINLMPPHPYWLMLHKNRQRIRIIKHSQSHPIKDRIPKCRTVYTAIADQHLIQRSVDFAQPLNDEQVILQLKLAAQNLFGLAWEALAIDFYRATNQQIITVAAPQTAIKTIITDLSHYKIKPTVIEPASQALNRLVKFCALNTPSDGGTAAIIKENYPYILHNFNYQEELNPPNDNDVMALCLALGLALGGIVTDD